MHDGHIPMFGLSYIARSVPGIDFKILHKSSIRFIIFYTGSTLATCRARLLRIYLRQGLKQLDGAYIASNRGANDLMSTVDSIDAEAVRTPLTLRKFVKGFFERVACHFKIELNQIVIVGGKLVAGIYGYNRIGFQAAWTEYYLPERVK